MNTPKPIEQMSDKNDGISLRDYFAAKAMQGMAAGESWCRDFDNTRPSYLQKVAIVAYAAADAMLEARNYHAK